MGEPLSEQQLQTFILEKLTEVSGQLGNMDARLGTIEKAVANRKRCDEHSREIKVLSERGAIAAFVGGWKKALLMLVIGAAISLGAGWVGAKVGVSPAPVKIAAQQPEQEESR